MTDEPPAPTLEELQNRIEALEDALHEYGRHHEGCLRVPCTCGLAELLGLEDTRA